MVEIMKLLCVYLLAVCVLLDKSSVSSSCVSSGNLYCYGYPDGNPPYVQCEAYLGVNATILANELTSCTVGEPYQRIIIGIYYVYGLVELRLDLGRNITELQIEIHDVQELYITPLRQHVNITEFAMGGYYYHWETSGIPISSYFPNLVHLEVYYERGITTLHNLLSNLTFLSSLTWTYSSLVNISDDSFKGLSSLSYIDLNRNIIPYLSSESFEHLPSLRDLTLIGNPLNCSCHLQWMSVVDTNGWVDIVGDCDTGLRADSPSTYSQCHNTESYQCFNKSNSCENVCINTPNSYVCACDAGYGLTLLEAEEACHDIDECVQDVAICQEQSCRNTLGSYECYCSEGFVSGAGGNTCVDVDECSNNPCEHNCTNTVGSYSCSCYENFVLEEEGHICECESGYNITADRSECVDVDECVYENGGCDSICVNTVGSFSCTLSVTDNPVTVTLMVISVLLVIALTTVVIMFVISCMSCIYYRKKVRSQSEICSQPKVSKDKNYVIFGSDEGKPHIYVDPDNMKPDVSPSVYPGYESDYTPMHSRKSEVPPHYYNVKTK